MKKISLYIIAVLITSVASAVFFSSCEKDKQNLQINEVSNTNSGISIKNGRMVFKDEASFDKHFNWIFENQSNPEIIYEFNKKYNFISMAKVYQQGMKIEDETSFQNYVSLHKNAFSTIKIEPSIIDGEEESSILYELGTPSSIHAYFSNENGIYQVGDEVRRLTNDYNLRTNCSQGKDLIKLLSLPTDEIPKNLFKRVSTKTSTKKWGQYSYRTAYRDSKHRLVARLKYLHSDNRTIWEARSTTQRKRCRWCPWVRENLSGNIGVKPRGRMKYKFYVPNIGWINKDINLDKDIVGNWSNVYYAAAVLPDGAIWDKAGSHCSVTHIGASKTIVNSNIFLNYN